MKKPSSQTWHVYTDGAARGNPGPAGAGIYITQNDAPIIERGIYLGNKNSGHDY